MGWWALQQNIAPSIKLGEAGKLASEEFDIKVLDSVLYH